MCEMQNLSHYVSKILNASMFYDYTVCHVCSQCDLTASTQFVSY